MFFSDTNKNSEPHKTARLIVLLKIKKQTLYSATDFLLIFCVLSHFYIRADIVSAFFDTD